MSKAHHSEPLQWHWLYIPLIAFFCFRRWALSPRPIFFIPSLFIDISSIIGPVQQAPGVMSILIEPIFLGHIFGPSCSSMVARETN